MKPLTLVKDANFHFFLNNILEESSLEISSIYAVVSAVSVFRSIEMRDTCSGELPR